MVETKGGEAVVGEEWPVANGFLGVDDDQGGTAGGHIGHSFGSR